MKYNMSTPRSNTIVIRITRGGRFFYTLMPVFAVQFTDLHQATLSLPCNSPAFRESNVSLSTPHSRALPWHAHTQRDADLFLRG
jgi:hypothetical protein